MKKVVIILFILFLITGCGNKNNTFSCYKNGTYSEYDILNRDKNLMALTKDDKEKMILEKSNSPVMVNYKEERIYKYNDKIIENLEIYKYTYVMDIEIDKEVKYYENDCDSSKDKYSECVVSLDNNTIAVQKKVNLDSLKNLSIRDIKNTYNNNDLYECK